MGAQMPSEPSTILFLCSGNYYRSRFAELLFNHLVRETTLAYRADSAGLWPNCRTHNLGPISAHTVTALRKRGVSLPGSHRIPRDVTEADIRGAALTIALKEAEHRPIVAERFPGVLARIEFWHVHDVEDAPPSEAIPLIEANVVALIARLQRGRALPAR
jgi:protein-tyrosine phosphatase